MLSICAVAYTMPVRAGGARGTLHYAQYANMGIFDGLKKAFENQDYSDSPATYEQTNARASHVLLSDLDQVPWLTFEPHMQCREKATFIAGREDQGAA